MEEKSGQFEDFDNVDVYNRSKARALRESTRNFVVEFGKDEAQIAFDMSAEHIRAMLDAQRETGRPPVRWINIWGPHRQLEVIDLLGQHYKFSPRLLAIIRSEPPEPEPQSPNKPVSRFKSKLFHKDDVEAGDSSMDTPRDSPAPGNAQTHTTHYAIVKQMMNFQSIDVGPHFLCIGANWMHALPAVADDDNDEGYMAEGNQRPLWSWLILCDDHTVLSFHEYPGPVNNERHLKAMRSNTLSVLTQLSTYGHDSADPISMQTVRQVLELDSTEADPGIEGASNLFYYLFDDWRAVYITVAIFRQKLQVLRDSIIKDMVTEKSVTTPDISIIPRLHILGLQIRQMHNLYEGYKNLVQRILEPKHTSIHGLATPPTSTGLRNKRVSLAQSASVRFERLGDRLQLLILSQTQEFLAEKDALTSSYFNLLARKDSAATSRLTRAATLLAKLSVLFLPVSLMTSYFSVQISDLQGVYTAREYWNSFAAIMSISFLALFFLDKSLMVITESLSGWVQSFSQSCARFFTRRVRRRQAERG